MLKPQRADWRPFFGNINFIAKKSVDTAQLRAVKQHGEHELKRLKHLSLSR